MARTDVALMLSCALLGKTTNRKIKEALAINKLEKERGSDKVMNQDKVTELSKIWLNLV